MNGAEVLGEQALARRMPRLGAKLIDGLVLVILIFLVFLLIESYAVYLAYLGLLTFAVLQVVWAYEERKDYR